MITAIEIENFKAVGSPGVRVGIRPITLLFGPNSVGKSTVFQAMQYAAELLSGKNADADHTAVGGDAVDLGGFASMVHGRDLTRKIRLAFELDLRKEFFPSFGGLHLSPGYGARLDEAVAAAAREAGDTTERGIAIRSLAETAKVELVVERGALGTPAYLSEYAVTWGGQLFCRVSGYPRAATSDLAVNTEHPLLTRVADGDDFRLVPLEIVQRLLDEHGAGPPAEFREDPWVNLEMLRSGSLPGWGVSLDPVFLYELRQEWDQYAAMSHDTEAPPPREANELQDAIAILSAAVATPGQLLLKWLSGLRYIGPLREVPQRGFLPVRSPKTDRWVNGLAAWDTLHLGDEKLVEEVSQWMSSGSKLAVGYRIQRREVIELDLPPLRKMIAEDRLLDGLEHLEVAIRRAQPRTAVSLLEEASGLAHDSLDVGVGLSQVVPVVVGLLADGATIVAIEQPELHVHPRIQVGLGDLLIEAATRPDKPAFVLVETHSEHLMLRLLRRIEESTEGELPPEVRPVPASLLSVNYVQARPQGSGIRVVPLRLDARGEFVDKWPGGFFDERADELFR